MKQFSFKNSAGSSNNAFEYFLIGSTANLWTAFFMNYRDVGATEVTAQVFLEAQGTDYSTRGVLQGANNKAVKQVEPDYIPFMKKGCCYAGVVTNLNSANEELSSYQYIKLSGSSVKFFVWGIANSTKTDFYTPKVADETRSDVSKAVLFCK